MRINKRSLTEHNKIIEKKKLNKEKHSNWRLLILLLILESCGEICLLIAAVWVGISINEGKFPSIFSFLNIIFVLIVVFIAVFIKLITTQVKKKLIN